MANVELYSYQLDAIGRMHNGCVLVGGVGSGKTRTALSYIYLEELKGKLKINGKGRWSRPKDPKDLYIVTTAKKRDTGDWQNEMIPFGLDTDPNLCNARINVYVDSWNNVKKYRNVYGAVFIFDEQRAVQTGTWGKSFIRIAKRNHWILLTATPADNYSDLIPLLIANGYYRNKTEFNMRHVVFKPYMSYPVIDHYVDTGILNKYRREMFVFMDSDYSIPKLRFKVLCEYDKELYKTIWKNRWNPYENCPIEETGKLFSLLRRCVNTDPSRFKQLWYVLKKEPKAIIFYNYSIELHMLRDYLKEIEVKFAEWNGEKHEELPTGEKWVYLCQYTAASEGWNCIATNTVIFFSLNYSYKIMKQSEGRVDRTNTPFKELHYYIFQSYAPIDLAIKKALGDKRNFNESAFLRQGS